MKLVILSTQRSGSTLVCDDFAGTKKLGVPTEHYIKLLNKNNCSLEDIENYFNKFAKTANGVEAVKIMANQLDPINNLYKKAGLDPYKRFLSFQKKNEYPYFFKQYKNAKFFRVFREDKIAQAVSLIFSEKTDVFHLVESSEKLKNIVGKETEDANIRNVSFEYNRDEIDQRLNFIKKNENKLDDFCSMYNIEPYLIKYENIISSNNYIKKIGNDLGISDANPAERSLKKIGGANALYWIEKYKKELNSEN